jgi:hypothetical protein
MRTPTDCHDNELTCSHEPTTEAHVNRPATRSFRTRARCLACLARTHPHTHAHTHTHTHTHTHIIAYIYPAALAPSIPNSHKFIPLPTPSPTAHIRACAGARVCRARTWRSDQSTGCAGMCGSTPTAGATEGAHELLRQLEEIRVSQLKTIRIRSHAFTSFVGTMAGRPSPHSSALSLLLLSTCFPYSTVLVEFASVPW